jgi:anthranilate synthase component 1
MIDPTFYQVKAMQLIAQCETEKRHVYAGAVGYFAFSGDVDTCIAIRTITVKNGIAYLQAGGGIVYDSDPDLEYQETVNKMAATARAIDLAEANALEKQPVKNTSTQEAMSSSTITEGLETVCNLYNTIWQEIGREVSKR